MAIDVVIPYNLPTSIQRDQMYGVRFVYSDQLDQSDQERKVGIFGEPQWESGEKLLFFLWFEDRYVERLRIPLGLIFLTERGQCIGRLH